MAEKKIFVSYDYDNDRSYRNLLSAWDANKSFDFAFEDHSTPKINSEDAGRIKAAISATMAAANCLLVIVGKETWLSDWVGWEIERAKGAWPLTRRREDQQGPRVADGAYRRRCYLGHELYG